MIVDADGVVTMVSGQPLELDRDYRVAMIRNLLTGLDHIEPLARWAREHPEKVPPLGCGREPKQILVDAFSISLWRAMGGFDVVDTDGDGMVTEAEIFAAVARVTKEVGSHITTGLIIRTLDTNQDNVISREEGARGDVPSTE